MTSSLASSRLEIGFFRSGRITREEPGPDATEEEKSDYRFSVLWAQRTRERFLKACDLHLDDILRETDQMVSDIFMWVPKLNDHSLDLDRDSWSDAAMERFPFKAAERVAPLDKATFEKKLKDLASSHYGLDGVTLARFKFTNWRDYPEEEFLDLALEHLDQLVREHETLRALFTSTVNKCRDHHGWRMQQRDIADNLRFKLLLYWPPQKGDL